MTFAELGINEEFILRLEKLGITAPTAVQEKVIPIVAQGKNIIFQSETGSGKTFAFLLPLLQKVEGEPAKIVVVSPSFELSSQLKQAAASVTNLKCALFIGGAPLKRQIETLKEKPVIVIGTPSRLLELVRLKKLKVEKAAAVIFDEADRLFAKEIIAETQSLAECFGQETQFIACSATVSKKLENAFSASTGLKNGALEKAILPKENVLREKIEHWAFFAEQRDKIDFLRSLLHALGKQKTLIFASRADQVENITSKLKYKNIECASLHARAKNQERQTMLAHFKSGKTKILITSDLASRGLDIPDISYIIQMDLPSDEDFFIHRSGRTARAGKQGINIVIGDEYELRNLAALEKKLGIVIHPKELHSGKIIDC